MLFNDFRPALTILMDISPKLAAKRISFRKKKNLFDIKGLAYFNLVRKKYLSLAKNNKKIKILNAEKSINENFNEIIDLIRKN